MKCLKAESVLKRFWYCLFDLVEHKGKICEGFSQVICFIVLPKLVFSMCGRFSSRNVSFKTKSCFHVRDFQDLFSQTCGARQTRCYAKAQRFDKMHVCGFSCCQFLSHNIENKVLDFSIQNNKRSDNKPIRQLWNAAILSSSRLTKPPNNDGIKIKWE